MTCGIDRDTMFAIASMTVTMLGCGLIAVCYGLMRVLLAEAKKTEAETTTVTLGKGSEK